MKLNKKLIQRIIKAIRKHPDQFQMTYLFWDYLDVYSRYGTRRLAGGCGTAGCIAGWALHLSSGRKKLKSSDRATDCVCNLLGEADRLLGFQWEGLELNHPLFYVRGWPWEFKEAYLKAKTAKTQAAVAARRLEHLLEHGK